MKTLRGQRPSYKIVKLIGEGLTGKVYKAMRSETHYGTHQVVAVKLLKSKNQVSVLRNEFSRLEKIESNHCVKLLGWENLQMGPALILEYLEGLNLWDLFRLKKLNAGLVREVISQAQVGLRDLEDQGLFHGDLSLKNIFVTSRGQIKLIDFGCGVTEGELLGNPVFMAPELKETRNPSLKTDLFSLGMIEAYLLQKGTRVLNPLDHFEQSTLLCRDPESRRFQSYRSSMKMRKVLGAKVCRALKERSESPNTQLISKGAIKTSRVFRKSIMATASFAFVLGIPKVPSKLNAASGFEDWTGRQSQMALAETSSEKPSIYIDKIRPGTYRWHWPETLGGGESRILLLENETLRVFGQYGTSPSPR